MANSAHLLINGIPYNLPDHLATAGPAGSAIQSLQGQIRDFVHGSNQPLTIQVQYSHGPVDLTLVPGHVDSYAVWVVEKPSTAGFAPSRIN